MRERVKKSFWVALVSIFATLGVVTANAQTIGVAVSDCPTWILDHAAPEITDYYVPENKYAGKTLTIALSRPPEEWHLCFNQRFEELTGAKLTMVPFPNQTAMLDQVRLALATSSGEYDLITTGAGGAKEYGLSGFLSEIPMPPDIDDFYEADVNQYSIGGKLFGMPTITDTNILYWRTDLFEEAGLDPNRAPQTYDELREYARILTIDSNGKRSTEDGFDKNSVEIYGLAFKGEATLAGPWEWYNYLFAFGGDVFDENYNVAIDSPESIASLEWVVDNFRKYNIYPAETLNMGYSDFHTLFIQGKLAMGINWPYMYNMSQDPSQSQVVGKVAIGRKPGQERHAGNLGGWSWNVFKMSKNQELAIAYAKWMGTPDVSWVRGRVGAAPVRKSITAMMKFENPVMLEGIGANLPDTMGVKWLDAGPSWMSVEKETWKAIQFALTGEKTAAQALKDAKSEMIEILERDRFKEELVPKLLGN